MNYYNDHDPNAAAWLRVLIEEGQIPAGDVDERPIQNVEPRDLAGYTQCHFFAGIGGWPLALRLAGYPDDQPVWTGSCPCPPFSCAGKKKACPKCGGKALPHPLQTGIFACVPCGHQWFADGRHLWPDFYRLIRQCGPAIVFGEQVAGADGFIWLAGVRACLENSGYAFGAADLCAAGVAAPHRRQRNWWVAHDHSGRCEERHPGIGTIQEPCKISPDRMAHAQHDSRCAQLGQEPGQRQIAGPQHTAECAGPGGMADNSRERWDGRSTLPGSNGIAVIETNGSDSWLEQPDRHGRTPRQSSPAPHRHGLSVGSDGGVDTLGHAHGAGLSQQCGPQPVQPEQPAIERRGSWSESRIIHCRDGKARRIPLEPAFFPLADGFPARVAFLKGFGNAIVPENAAIFIRAAVEAIHLKL